MGTLFYPWPTDGEADIPDHTHVESEITDLGPFMAPGDDADQLGSGDAADNYVLTADGSGNAYWEPVTASAVDHGSLGGLNDDDHPHYALADGSRGSFAATSHSHTLANVSDAGDSAGLDVGTSAGTVAAGDHDHAGVYSASGHNHDSDYAPAGLLDEITTNAQTGTTYTLVLSDAGKRVTLTNASAVTLTVPPNSSVAFPVGTRIIVAQRGAGQVTVAAGAGVTINTAETLKLADQYAYAELFKHATDEWDLVGRLEAA